MRWRYDLVGTEHTKLNTIWFGYCARVSATGVSPWVSTERKADFDVEISVDAVSWVENYDTFVLFSGDSDFVYLTEFLKKQGRTVIVLSKRGHIADELRKSPHVDYYVDYYQDIYKLKRGFLRKSS